jgi:DNA-binding IclR family transcriptional regulator
MEMKQAAQVVDLLEFFGASGQPATLAEVSKRLDWPKSSAFKLLAMLSRRGYLYEPYGRGMYYPSPRWRVVIAEITRNEPVPDALMKLLQALATKTSETVVLASVSGLDAFFIEAIESPKAVRYAAEIGKTVPLHATAVGRALLAQLPAADRAALLGKVEFRKFTSATLLSARAIETEIAAGIKRGYFEGKGELNEDLAGVAMPLHIPGRPLAVMVAGPLHRTAPRYAEIARLMAQQLGLAERALGAAN